MFSVLSIRHVLNVLGRNGLRVAMDLMVMKVVLHCYGRSDAASPTDVFSLALHFFVMSHRINTSKYIQHKPRILSLLIACF